MNWVQFYDTIKSYDDRIDDVRNYPFRITQYKEVDPECSYVYGKMFSKKFQEYLYVTYEVTDAYLVDLLSPGFAGHIAQTFIDQLEWKGQERLNSE